MAQTLDNAVITENELVPTRDMAFDGQGFPIRSITFGEGQGPGTGQCGGRSRASSGTGVGSAPLSHPPETWSLPQFLYRGCGRLRLVNRIAWHV